MVMRLALSVAAVAVVSGVCRAQEEESSDGVAELAAVATNTPPPKASFLTLPLCRRVEGAVSVCAAGAAEWSPAEEGRFYPLGTSFRTEGHGRLTISFASDATASIAGDAEFGTRQQPLGVSSRTIVLKRGVLDLKLPDNMPQGAFLLAAPGFVVKNPAGESTYVYEDMGDGDRVTVSCRSGTLGVEGRHFDIPSMRTSHTVVIRTSRDLLFTSLYGRSGDYTVKIDKDIRYKDEVGDGGRMIRTEEHEFADFCLSPQTKIVINRSVPAVGERMSAFIMAFDASGEQVGEGITVCEGRPGINCGELASKKQSEEELAKRAAEAAETSGGTKAETASENKEEN